MTEGPETPRDRTHPAMRWARTTAERHSVLLAYLIPTLLSVIAVQTWFESGTTIASGDLSPPVAPEADYWSHWNHLTSGEGSPTFDVVGLPYSAWLDVWGSIGVGEEVAQRLWLTALFAGSTAAVVFLAFGFAFGPLAAGAAGLLATFNAYRLVTGPDGVPMAALLVAALLGGLVVRAALRPERRPSVILFAIVSLGLAYVMANPPHVVLVVLWVAVCAVIALAMQPDASRRILGYLARAVPLALVVNAWWIVPAFLTVTASGFHERFAAEDIDAWTWTHERASLANALTLNTHWAWSFPEYFPYAEGLGDSPFDLFLLALPFLALIGAWLGWRGHARAVGGLAATGLVAAWLTTGLNGPLPETNRWLYDNMPGYWLFREPTKLLLLVALPMAILAGLGVSRLLATGTSSRQHALAAGLVAAAVVYVHPLFTGDVVPDERPLLPSAHVRVPDAWENASATLNALPGAGKVLVLPRADYYQLPTTWGYYGTSFTKSMISRPVLEVQPGGYFEPPRVVDSLIGSIETDLATGRTASIGRRLSALGVQYVLLRRDIDPEFPDRRIVRPSVLAESLARTPGLHLVRSFELLELYRLGRVRDPGREVFAATPVLYAGTDDAIAPAIDAIPGPPGLVRDRRDQRSITDAGVRPTRVVRVEQEVARRIEVKRQGERLRVRLADPFRLTVGGQTVGAPGGEAIAVDVARRTPMLVTAGEVAMPFRRVPGRWTRLGLVGLQDGQAVGVWRRSRARGVDLASSGRLRDCNASDNRGPREVGLRASIVRRSGLRALRLSARAHAACVGFPLVSGRSEDLFRVRFRYRQVRGRLPRACVWQIGLDRCASVPELLPGSGWRTFAATIRPHRRSRGLTLYLYADGPGEAPGTVAEYRAIRVERYGRAGIVKVDARVRTVPMSSNARALAFASPPVPPKLDLERAGPVGDCQRLDERTAAQVGLDARVVRDTDSRILRLTAREHSACVSFGVSPIDQGARAYRILLDYRTVSGRRPRVCLWQQGPDRCASLPVLRAGRTWHRLDETIELDTDVQALHLFVYADGGAGSETVAEYRNVHVGPVGSVALVGIPRERPLPKIVARRDASWKFHVRVENARGPFLLATSEAFAPGWTASVQGHDDAGLRHVEVNGYANGWLVPFRGSYDMTLEYAPERYARAARVLSILGLILVLGWAGLRRLSAFDVQRQPR